MRFFSYNEPIWGADDDLDEYGHIKIHGNEVVTVSEDDIRRDYFPQWEARMIEKFGEDMYRRTYGFHDCLEDWMITNWAWEVKE